ncbi:MAG: hypothetical protein ACI8S6_003027 [Myxococcota bacterium]|jgi:hypothetical protein
MRTPILLLAVLIGCGDKDTDPEATDADGDGFVGADDCDDDNADVNPDGVEVCDGIDNDCDNKIDNATEGLSTFYVDNDGDGFGNALSSIEACDVPSGYADDSTDCNDGDADSYPGADEVCDFLDNDCDGDVDNDAVDADSWYSDSDSDGYGDPATEQTSCDEINGTVSEGGDCDDGDRTISPGTSEICDGIDNNCNNQIDEDGAVDGTLYYTDGDGDGYGDPDTSVRTCDPLKGGVTNGFDCDDTTSEASPVAEEVCDFIDNDCDEQIDEGVEKTFYPDSDGDGYGTDKKTTTGCEAPTGYGESAGDCDDTDDLVNPGALDLANDGVDLDCDGSDGAVRDIDDATIRLEGSTAGLLGYNVSICDVDDDGLGDVIITTPFDNSYSGGALVFYGANASTWSNSMVPADADTTIQGGGQFFGFGLACGDFDGDGYNDIALARGEIDYFTSYDTDFEIMIFSGSAKGWGATLSESDATGSVEFEMGVPIETPSVYSFGFWAGDTNDDGADDLIVDMSDGGGTYYNADGDLWVLDISTLGSLTQSMDDYLIDSITPDTPDAISSVRVTDDLDGDGLPDLFIGQNGYVDGDEVQTGLASWLPSTDTDTIANIEAGSLAGIDAEGLFGGAVALGDFDGDGNTDLVVSAYSEDTTEIDAGALYAYSDFTSTLTSSYLAADSSADAIIDGETASGIYGLYLEPMSDFDIDGADELVILERSGASGGGMLYAASGALMTGTGLVPDDIKLLSWQGPGDVIFGFDTDVGDIDGDGYDDIIISGVNQTSGASNYYNGETWIILSSALGL